MKEADFFKENFTQIMVIISFLILFPVIQFTSAASSCNLNVSLINQDPYPAIPGSHAEVVFQMTGVENPQCQGAVFNLRPKYPFSLEKNTSTKKVLQASTFVQDYKKSWMIPYELRIDSDALDGDKEIDVEFSSGRSSEQSYITKTFTIKVEDVIADFEVFVKDYNQQTKTITFEILNIAESDVEAVSIEIQDQEAIKIKGPRRNNIGDLDSNEYTTAEFEASLEDGKIQMEIFYTDETGERRIIEKTTTFNKKDFANRAGQETSTPWFMYIIVLIILVSIGYWIYKKRKKKKSQK